MKKTLSSILLVAAFFGALCHASAGTVNLYLEDWGSVKGGKSAGTGNVGWTFIVPSANNPPYEGIYGATGASDVATGNPLNTNTVYYTGLAPGQAVMFYTTDAAGAGADGDAAFSDINPASYTNLTLSVEANDEGSLATNYFAVQVGGSWYVSATPLTDYAPTYPAFVNASTPYTTTASAWKQLTLNANSVTIGAAASAALSGPITGIGIVAVGGTTSTGQGGWNYNQVTVSAYAQTPTANVYTEDWGSIKGGKSAGTGNLGWTFVEPAANNPPYEGIYGATGASDMTSGAALPTNTVYYTGLAPGQAVMFYTTDTAGAGSEGDSSFADIDPGLYTNLTLSIEGNDEGSLATNYFAVQVGGAWYVSTTALMGTATTYPAFANSSIPYSQLASAWDQLTINANSVTIGAPASANLSGPITGIGIVAVGGATSTGQGGWNYNEITVSSYAPPKAETPPPQTLYTEDWGTLTYAPTGGPTGNGTLAQFGWSSAGIAYTGTYPNPGAFDPLNGLVFPLAPIGNIGVTNDSAYASVDQASYIGVIYTTDTNGAGANGDSAFVDINPANYSGDITFNAEVQYNSTTPATSYFAVQIGAVAGVGGQWYVSTNALLNNAPEYPFFYPNSLAFNPAATNWNTLSFPEGALDPTGSVDIGGTATNNLSGSITGFGLVLVGDSTYANGTAGYGLNLANLTITTPLVNKGAVAPKIDAAGFSQTAYAGGTASFAIDSYVGTAPVSYNWTLTTSGGPFVLQNGVTGSGSIISGVDSNVLTIMNVGASDVGTYSCEVANLYGADYSTNYATNTLTVNPVPGDILYAETFPFVGPFPTGESPAADGWSAVVPDNPDRLNFPGRLDAYETGGVTTGLFTSSATDVPGLSGLPFTNINPANFTFVSFRAGMANPAGTAAVYFAVQMTGGQWYSSSSGIQLSANSSTTNNYGLQFSPAMLEWNTLTVNGTSVVIGPVATADLTGDITGAGLVFVFSGTAAAQFSLYDFELVTDATPPALASFPSEPDVPYPQTVYQGSGVSFYFTEAGTLPLTNHWEFDDNGMFLTNGVTASGSIISGADTTEITLQNVGPADQGTYDPTVSNPAGTANVDGSEYGPPPLTVTPPPVGLIYNESFPLYVPIPGGTANNQPLSLIGWTNQSDTPDRVFQLTSTALEGLGAAFAYESSTTNSLFYASTETDTGYSGLPFVAFDPANYPPNSIQFTTAMSAGDSAYTNVSASFAVEEGGQWYAMATPVEPTNPATSLSTTAYTTLGPQTYSPLASQWNALTLVGTAGVIVGGHPAQNLSGPITAAGLLFQHFANAGGDLNYDFYQIQASGNAIGGLNVVPLVSNKAMLTWVGNPAVFLQSSTDLIHWAAVPGTQGAHMLTVSDTVSNVFYRVAGPQ